MQGYSANSLDSQACSAWAPKLPTASAHHLTFTPPEATPVLESGPVPARLSSHPPAHPHPVCLSCKSSPQEVAAGVCSWHWPFPSAARSALSL
eukprot:scaffold10866_cov21-Tisochrysis_lutea.AAC.2